MVKDNARFNPSVNNASTYGLPSEYICRNSSTTVKNNFSIFISESESNNKTTKSTPAQKPVAERVEDLMSPKTIETNGLKYAESSVPYINMARTYLNQIVEVNSWDEYYRLPRSERDTTQMAIIENLETTLCNGQKYKASPEDSWCAWSTSAILKDSGIKSVPVYSAVEQFRFWGKQNDRYKEVKLNNGRPTKDGIQEQLPHIKQGDLIIFKAKRPRGSNASHMGFIEFVDPEKGTITTLEGNGKGQGGSADQRDGYIRRVYTIQDLIKNGYSGYIEMTGVK